MPCGGPETTWSKPNFLLQHKWLLEEAGLEHIISNKNHYTRWEGRLAFYRWCEEVGIRSDQTRGRARRARSGSRWAARTPIFRSTTSAILPAHLDVLQVNMLTQDLVIRCPPEYGRQLLDSAVRHHGVAHFLFHPAHILKPGVADAVRELVDYGRAQGLEWWTCDQIQQWERAHARFTPASTPARLPNA